MEHSSCCHSAEDKPHHPAKKKGYFDPLFWVFAVAGLLAAASALIPAFAEFNRVFFHYIKIISLPILLGFLIGGVIEHYIPREYISKHLAVRKKRTIIYAVSLGFLMSACSHGILALSMQLHKKGASGPAVVSFLLASPWANLPVTFLLFGFFGFKAFLIIGSAFLIALTTGFIFVRLESKGLIERNSNSVGVDPDFSIRRDIRRRLKGYVFSWERTGKDVRGIFTGAVRLADMVLFWVVLGMIVSGLAGAFIPGHIFQHYFGPTVLGLVLTLLLATVIEVCSEGTAPLAFELYRQSAALGNSFAFLMAGVATDVTEIGLLWKNLGPKTALWMLAVTLPQVILYGLIFNRFF